MIAVLLWAQSAGAVPFRAESAASTGTIAYQGRLADSSGNPLTSTLNMSFRLYGASTGGAPLWSEQWTGSNGVKVSDGLFNVMLGSLTPIPQSVITGNANLFLGITVGTDDEMTPRVQLGSVPFAVQALSVPDGSITKAKLAGDVSIGLEDGSVTTTKIADGAVTTVKLHVNDGLNVNGKLAVTGEIKGGYLCAGHTNTDGTGWKDSLPTIYIDVDTSGCGFSATPMYFTSLAGDSTHAGFIGTTNIYLPSATGFRVYLVPSSSAYSAADADGYNWHIQWVGIKQKTTGLDTGSYAP